MISVCIYTLMCMRNDPAPTEIPPMNRILRSRLESKGNLGSRLIWINHVGPHSYLPCKSISINETTMCLYIFNDKEPFLMYMYICAASLS